MSLVRKLFIPLVIITLLGCTTAKQTKNINTNRSDPTEKVVEISQKTEDDYQISAMKYLTAGNVEKYFYILNKNISENNKLTLLLDWEKQQISLIDSKLSERKSLDAVFYLNNLKAFDKNMYLKQKELVYTSLQNNGYKELAQKYSDTQTTSNINKFSIESYDQLLSKIYLSIEYEKEDGVEKRFNDSFSGSGVVISHNMILTNYHVIKPVFENKILSYSIDIEINKEKYEHCTIVSVDTMNDFAVLKVKKDIPVPDNYNFFDHLGRKKDLKLGEGIYVYANHSGLTNTLTKGIISSTERPAHEAGYWIQIDAGVTGGASGGLLLGENGLIYGIIIATLTNDDNISFAIPSDTIRYNTEKLLKGNTAIKPWLGLKLSEEDEEVTIDFLFSSSILKQYGIEPGSVLLQINNMDISAIDEAQNIITEMEPGNIVKLLIDEEVYYVPLRKRPETPVYSSYYGKTVNYSYYPGFGFELDMDDITVRSILIDNEYSPMKFYIVKRVKVDGYLYNNGIRKDDYLGIIDADINRSPMKVLLFHLPAGKAIKELKNVDDYIYELKRGVYATSLL